jgi:exosome complex RNA-binding protein Rrp42 (RNase PH superfamily)
LLLQGDTIVVAGVKLELAQPKPEEPDLGFVVPNVELPPLCHSQFKPGPPSEMAQCASTFVKRAIANSGLVDLRSLCVSPGKLVWVVHVDMVCLNYDGNVVDCALKAAVAALREEEDDGSHQLMA